MGGDCVLMMLLHVAMRTFASWIAPTQHKADKKITPFIMVFLCNRLHVGVLTHGGTMAEHCQLIQKISSDTFISSSSRL